MQDVYSVSLMTKLYYYLKKFYQEFNEKFAEKYRIMKFASKVHSFFINRYYIIFQKVTRKYAFNLPDIPGESEYLEVRYSSDYQALPIDSSGRSFSKVFGTNTSRYNNIQSVMYYCIIV